MRWPLLRGLCGSALIALAGLAYEPVPTPSWVKAWAPLAHLRAQPGHIAVGAVVGFAGLVLLTWGWWTLRTLVRGRPEGVRVVRWAVAAWSVPLLAAPPLFSGDGWSYVATGYLTGHGWSPYLVGPGVVGGAISSAVSHKWLFTPTPYGPLPLMWGAAFSHLTGDPWVLLVLYRLLALIGVALVAWAVPRLATRCGRDPADASALVVASPFLVAQGIGGLHNDIVLAGLVLAALAVTRRDIWWWGAALAGAAAAVKVTGGLVAVGVVLLSLPVGAGLAARARRTIEVAAVSVAVLLGAGVASGLGLGWVHGLLVPTRERTLLAPTLDLAWHVRGALIHDGRLGHELLGVLRPMHTVWFLDAAALVLVAAWALLDRRFAGTPSALAVMGGVLFAASWLSPVMHYWYFLWCLPLLGCVRLPRWAASGLLALLVVLGLTAEADADLQQPWTMVLTHRLLAVVPLLAAAVGWWRARRDHHDPSDPGAPAIAQG